MSVTTEEVEKQLGISLNIRSDESKKRYQESLRKLDFDPTSQYQQAEMASPLVNTHADITYRYEAMALHSHNFYEIICCRSNCGVEYLVGPYRYSLQKGDIILVRPGVSHCVILPDPLLLPYERDIIWLSTSFQNSFRNLLDLPPVTYGQDLPTYLIRTAGTQWEFLCDLIHEGVLIEERKLFCWQTKVIGNTIMVVSYLWEAYNSPSVQPLPVETPDLLDGIVGYLEVHFQEKLTLSQVARHFFVSERTVGALFRKRLGITFTQFLTQRRLIAAKEMIQEGISLERVAEESGFTDYSTFYRAFCKELGISPKQFRKNSAVKDRNINFIDQDG